jgi:hypothetical protein
MAKRTEQTTTKTKTDSRFATIEEAIEEIRRGRMVVSATTRTGRTRATSPWRRSSRPLRPSTSWPSTAAA